MWKRNLIKEYKENVDIIIQELKASGATDEEVQEIIRESLSRLKNKAPTSGTLSQIFHQNVFKITALVSLFLSIFVYVLLHVHIPTSSIVLRNVQGLTYPALKIVRTLSVPIIKCFPALTDLYDESCLVENPYFQLSDMECWPCESAHFVIDLTGIDDINLFQKSNEGIPFIVKTNQSQVTFKNLRQLYNNYTSELLSDSRRIKISNSNVRSLHDLMNLTEKNLSSNFQFHWRFNKMTAARAIRKLFPKPYFLPDRSGQAVERFVYIDGHENEFYSLPNTECSYIFVMQGSGERTITLKPSNECKQTCKTMSVLMKPSYVLVYNWWYWRPVSLPTKNSTDLSISYINSYC